MPLTVERHEIRKGPSAMQSSRFALTLLSELTVFCIVASATTPVVKVTSPTAGSQDSSPVNFTASASSPACPKGIAAMRIYIAPREGVYTVDSNKLDTNINMAPGSYQTVVQAWDNCGGVGKAAVNITVTSNQFPPPKFLYSSASRSNRIYEYLINPSTGGIHPTSQVSVATGSRPARLASDRGGFRLYVANTGSENISGYFINRNDGSLQPVPGTPGPFVGYPTSIVVHPSGKSLYVTSTVGGQQNYIYAFAVESNGALLPVAGSPFTSQYLPTTAVIDSTGNFLYIATINDPYVEGYRINATDGALTPLPGEPYVLPGQQSSCSPGALDLAFAQNGQHLVVPELCDGVIAVYDVNPSTGELTNAPGSPVVDPPPASYQPVDLEAISVDPLNRWWYLYETFPSEIPGGDLTTFTAQHESERTGQNCGDIVRADPSGKFVYAIGNTTRDGVCGASPGAILGFAVNQSNGALTPLPGSPFPSPTSDDGYDGLAVTH